MHDCRYGPRRKNDGDIDRNYYIEKGEQIEAYDNAWNAIGMMFLHFPDTKTAEAYYLRLDELIKIVVE